MAEMTENFLNNMPFLEILYIYYEMLLIITMNFTMIIAHSTLETTYRCYWSILIFTERDWYSLLLRTCQVHQNLVYWTLWTMSHNLILFYSGNHKTHNRFVSRNYFQWTHGNSFVLISVLEYSEKCYIYY